MIFHDSRETAITVEWRKKWAWSQAKTADKNGATTYKHGATIKPQKPGQDVLTWDKSQKEEKAWFRKHSATPHKNKWWHYGTNISSCLESPGRHTGTVQHSKYSTVQYSTYLLCIESKSFYDVSTNVTRMTTCRYWCTSLPILGASSTHQWTRVATLRAVTDSAGKAQYRQLDVFWCVQHEK